MIQLRLGVEELAQVRALCLLAARRGNPESAQPHGGAHRDTNSKMACDDIGAPGRGRHGAPVRHLAPSSRAAQFPVRRGTGRNTTIEDQLDVLGRVAPAKMRTDLEEVWQRGTPPAAVKAIWASPDDGRAKIVDAIWRYWQVALAPHWQRMRAVLEADVVHRASRIANGGMAAALSDLHPKVSLQGMSLLINKPHHQADETVAAGGLRLVPSVFAWPNLIVETGHHGPPSLTYGARGVGGLWEPPPRERTDDEALGALFGRSRAAVLDAVGIPMSTTALAAELRQSPAAISSHLSVLRRSGLVTSWRSGRRVLYQRTWLATSIIIAGEAPAGYSLSL